MLTNPALTLVPTTPPICLDLSKPVFTVVTVTSLALVTPVLTVRPTLVFPSLSAVSFVVSLNTPQPFLKKLPTVPNIPFPLVTPPAGCFSEPSISEVFTGSVSYYTKDYVLLAMPRALPACPPRSTEETAKFFLRPNLRAVVSCSEYHLAVIYGCSSLILEYEGSMGNLVVVEEVAESLVSSHLHQFQLFF